jgi:hypothetical protein
MAVVVRLVDRVGVETSWEARPGDGWRFGRSGQQGAIAVSDSTSVSKHALDLAVTLEGRVRIRCLQRTGSVEVLRANGLYAASLTYTEEGSFVPPLDIVLHTAQGAFATISITPSGPPAVPERTGARVGPRLSPDQGTTRVGWNLAMIQQPYDGLDWFVAAAMSAVLVRAEATNGQGRQVQRTALERACGHWLRVPGPKTPGWLESKFKQARRALNVTLAGNPSHELGDYVIRNGFLSEGDLAELARELAVRRSSGPHG